MRRALLLLLLLALPAGAAPGGLRLLWEDRFPWPVRWVVAADSGILLVGSDRGSLVRAWDGASGTRLWQRSARAGLWSPPAVRGTTLYLSPHDQALLSLRLDTGDLLWWLGPRFPEGPKPLPGLPEAPPLNRAAPLPLADQVATVSLQGRLSVVGPTGEIARQVDLQDPRRASDRFWATPTALEGVLYAGTVQGSLWQVPLEAPDRARRYRLQTPVDKALGSAAREVRAPLATCGGRVLVATMDGTLHAWVPEGQGLVPDWRRVPERRGAYQCTPEGLALPAPVPDEESGTVYLGLLDRVVAVQARSGAVQWEHRLPAPLATRPAPWRGDLLVGLRGGRLLALDRRQGQVRWSADLPASPTAGPALWQDQVVLGFADGSIRAWDLSSRVEAQAGADGSPRASSSSAAIRIPR